jgi:hypothetical protein
MAQAMAPRGQGWGERIGTAVVVLAVIGLVWSAFQYGGGVDTAFFGLIGAFALCITGLGVHVAAREGRLRREADSDRG